MSNRIPLKDALEYLDNFVAVFKAKGAEENSFTQSYFIDRKIIESILKRAEEENIQCIGVRVFLAKKNKHSAEDVKNEIMHGDGEYNIVLFGVDNTHRPISSTKEIYDNFDTCPSVCPPFTDLMRK